MPLLLLATALPLPAQDLMFRSTSTVDLPGAAGALLKVAEKFDEDLRTTTETTWVTRTQLRQDDGGARSTIFDGNGRHILFLDHEDRSWSRVALDSIAEAVEALADAAADADPAEVEPEEEEEYPEEDEEPEDVNARQKTLLSLRTEVIEARTDGIDPTLFEAPAEYREALVKVLLNGG